MIHRRNNGLLVLILAAICNGDFVRADDPKPAEPLRAVMLLSSDVTTAELAALKADDSNAVVLRLTGLSDDDRQREVAAAKRILNADLKLYYWIEIARCPELADAHPEWMASLQGHSEWRRLFDAPPEPDKNSEVVKNYPWVPILYEEAFAAHLQRVRRLLEDKPTATGIFLNDLQGGPSACGCGHHLCRWTADYGPIKTARPTGDDAAARFVKAVSKIAPDSQCVPVWATECEQHDGADDGLCAGVGCFKGICWKAWSKQLGPLEKQSQQIAVLAPFRAFDRDLPLYGKPAGWITFALKSFQTFPVANNARPVPASRLIAVLQGWDVSPPEIDAQIQRAAEAGTSNYVVVRSKIDQSWQPRLHKFAE